MLIRRANDIRSSEITSESLYRERRRFMQATGVAALTASGLVSSASIAQQTATKIEGFKKSPYSTNETPNSFKDITTYNNFYEFGTDKSDPARHAHKLKVRPWSIAVEGAVKHPRTIGIEDLLKLPQEERVYRMRCVEGWSMVIPWIGFEFSQIAKMVEPTSDAKFVELLTAVQPDTMHGVRMPVLDWPYTEGLRMDEAMHPLTILSVGLYGQILPNQNGAPIRLVVPWKYGFKSVKSIAKIRFVERQPKIAWEKANASEYGFYSNVNPTVDHPRWSQATERRIGEFAKRKTTLFNGYGEQVAGLYAGMDLKKFY
ncbi:MAG: protein-methionine-sulfoxide reductase catalytic subunit MsrP [Burkholderiales bacterium]